MAFELGLNNESLPIQYFLQQGCLFLILLVLAEGAYNKYFHPLAGIPGPFWGSVTKLYLAHMISSIPIKGLALHQKYGPVVRLAPNLVSISDAEMLPVLYHKRADKTPFYSSWLFGKTTPMFQTLQHKEHARKKKLIASCCSMKMVKRFEQKLDAHIDAFCNTIRQRSSLCQKPLDLSHHIRLFLSDAFSDITYGESLGCVSAEKDNGGLMQSFQDIYTLSGFVAVFPNILVPLVRSKIWNKFLFRYTGAFRGIQQLFTHYHAMKPGREQLHKETPRFFDPILTKDPPSEENLTEEDIRAENIIFMSAALEDVAAFVTPFIKNIIEHALVYDRLCAEIACADEAGALSRPVASYDETCQLPYFMACIYETLRHDAPAQTILPRYVSEPGIQAHGLFLPAGTEAGASPYIVHRDKHVFGDDADDFRPERWLEDEKLTARMHRFGMWFGYGDRECPGKAFAHLEFQKLLVEILRRFDVGSAEVPGSDLRHEMWAVAMFWNHWVQFSEKA